MPTRELERRLTALEQRGSGHQSSVFYDPTTENPADIVRALADRGLVQPGRMTMAISKPMTIEEWEIFAGERQARLVQNPKLK